MLNYLTLQSCQKLRKTKCSNSFSLYCQTNILFYIIKNYDFAGPTPSVVFVLAPPPLGMEKGSD